MTESIPVRLLEKWINDLQSILKQASQEAKSRNDLNINLGRREGLAQIQHKITTWRRHEKNKDILNRSGKKFLKTRDVNLSDGRFRKLEWYEGDSFLVLAWRHGKNEEKGELMLETEDTMDLSKTYLVYEGGLCFDELVALARKGGLKAVRNHENQGEWVEKVWT